MIRMRVSKRAVLAASVVFLLLVSVSISNAAFVYKWVDKNGSVNFTDDLSKVPPEYRNQIQVEETRDSEETQTPSPAASVQETKEEKRGARGMSEDYWRDRVRPWKKQLEETTEGYENINRKIGDALETRRGRFLSKTQYNFGRIEVENLMKERGTYEAKKKEANEMLAKIAKEAEEAKADPAWLK